MKVSHESPLILLKESREYNDYDYALVHLFEKNEEYYEFFRESLEMGREVILDNSIFELGKAFDMEKYLLWINTLKPTYYIVPDVLDSMEGTVKNMKKWIDEFKDRVEYDGKMIGVVQGKNYEEAVKCYEYMNEVGVDKIAFSFNCDFYTDNAIFSNNDTKLLRWMEGRVNTIYRMRREGVINEEKEHHLLGVALPQEIQFYQSLPFITSVDTSNPIVHGLKFIRYSEMGLYQKEETKLADLLHYDWISDAQRDIIKFNIKKFREFANNGK